MRSIKIMTHESPNMIQFNLLGWGCRGDRVLDSAGGDGPEQGEAGDPRLPGGDGTGDPGATKMDLFNILVFIHK